ncbi:MAG: toll/interleukin-1 receptor domain-containing protein [Krumholzibacteria bacterium]|nr:toll/interleukin-1 receptor domain-containing protein [Candidatus Krumholzibacteria bacterium]
METKDRAPRVFLSHASEDKERFVFRLAEQLRERGIDVWLDFWEILPGDSLVDKIFNEGLRNASAVILVLSQFSVSKPWVKEELNAAVVGRIQKGARIIPVVLDGCDVPEPLRSTVWQRVDDLEDPTQAIESIVAAVYDHRPKPPLGPPPAYVTADAAHIYGLNSLDSAVFKYSCEFMVESGEYLVEPGLVLRDLAIPEAELRDTLDVLENHGLVEVHATLGPNLDSFQVTNYGWSTYFEAYVPNFSEIHRNVILAILNDGLRQTNEIARHLGVPQLFVDHIVGELENERHILVSQALGAAGRYIGDVRGSLKRLLEN